MMGELQSLTYCSRSLLGQNGEMMAEIDRILAVSRRNNREYGITGALLCSEGWFAQVLEGPPPAVELMFEKIVLDNRHRDIRVLHLKPLIVRNFSEWSMAFAGVMNRSEQAQRIEGLLDNPETIAGSGAGRDLIGVMKNLINKFEADRI